MLDQLIDNLINDLLFAVLFGEDRKYVDTMLHLFLLVHPGMEIQIMHSITKKRSLTFIALTLFALLILSLSFAFRTNASAAADSGHQVLPANDGWAAASGGTTGGSAATSAHVYTVTTRAQLVQDLGGAKSTDTTPKI